MGLFGGGKGKGGNKGGSSKGGSKSSSSSSSKSNSSKSSSSSSSKGGFGSKVKSAIKSAFGGGASKAVSKGITKFSSSKGTGSKSISSIAKSASSKQSKGGFSTAKASGNYSTKSGVKNVKSPSIGGKSNYSTNSGSKYVSAPTFGSGNRNINSLGLDMGGNNNNLSYDYNTDYQIEPPQEDNVLTDIEAWIENMQEQGYEINPELDLFDQATLDRFLETAKRQVRPEFAQQIDAIKYDVIRDMGQLKSQYEGDVADREAQYTSQLGNFREGAASSGLAFSGQRGSGELGMQAAQNRNLESLGLGFKNDINRMGRAAEQKIGAGNVDYTAPNVRSYSANLDNFPKFQTGDNLGGYTKGAFQVGDIQRDEEAAARNRAEAIKYQAGVRKRAGRSYQDLFN